MAVLDFNDKNIKGTAIPKMNEAIVCINKAIENIPSGPDGFESERALSCRDNLKDIKKAINVKLDDLKKVLNKIIKEEQQQSKVASVLSVNKIKRRENKKS